MRRVIRRVLVPSELCLARLRSWRWRRMRLAAESSPFIFRKGRTACPAKRPTENLQRPPIRKAVCPIKSTRESSQRPPIKIATHASEGSLACPSSMRGHLGESKLKICCMKHAGRYLFAFSVSPCCLSPRKACQHQRPPIRALTCGWKPSQLCDWRPPMRLDCQ